MKYHGIREEALKNKVEQDFFDKFDCTEIIRDIDFAVKVEKIPHEEKSSLSSSRGWNGFVRVRRISR